MERRALVLDANILIRAVLGQRVRHILEDHADNVSFFIPETAYAEAEQHLASLVAKHGGDPVKALAFLGSIAALGSLVGRDLYGDFETEARRRLGTRDPEDWPILAAALALGCPIWTEDTDFFGCGVLGGHQKPAIGGHLKSGQPDSGTRH
jgi:predicted nucleic acid-binding protein